MQCICYAIRECVLVVCICNRVWNDDDDNNSSNIMGNSNNN